MKKAFQNYFFNKAFTMLELIFVIVIIGVISAVVMHGNNTNPLREAAAQLVSHIRYTQHLAMVDDTFDINNNSWYKERWQLRFYTGSYSDDKWAYTIFSDKDGAGNPSSPEVAKNPQDNNVLLSGGSVGSSLLNINGSSFVGMKKLNLGLSYGVDTIDFSSSCQSYSSKRITFDYLGRPMRGNIANNSSSYDNINDLITETCSITLNDSSGNSVVILIEPETGYTHIQ